MLIGVVVPCLVPGFRAQAGGGRDLPGGRLPGGLVEVPNPCVQRLRDARDADPASVRQPGAPMRGIFAGNVVRRGSVPANSRALLTLRAPAGMRFSSLELDGVRPALGLSLRDRDGGDRAPASPNA